MKPSDMCKQAGLSSLKEMIALSDRSRDTIYNWARSKPELFKAELDRAVAKKEKLSNAQ